MLRFLLLTKPESLPHNTIGHARNDTEGRRFETSIAHHLNTSESCDPPSVIPIIITFKPFVHMYNRYHVLQSSLWLERMEVIK